MSTTKKYVSLEKLGLYDEKIKAKIAADDAEILKQSKAYSDGLATNYDPAGSSATVQGKLDEEVLRAKAAEEANANAAKQAQDEVDALELVVGGMYTNEQIDKAIEDAQTTATYDDAEVRGLISDLDTNKADKAQVATDIADAVKAEEDARKEAVAGVQGAVDTLVGTHATDKATLEGAIALKADQTALQAEIDRATEAEGGLEDRIETMEAFWEAAKADGTDENVIDTLKEIQEYIAGDETGAAEMAASIKQNADDIDALEGRMDTAEGDIDALEGRMTTVEGAVVTKAEKEYVDEANEALSGKITELEGKFGEGEGTVGDMIADAVAEEASRVDGLLAEKVDKVDGKGLSTNDLTDELKAQYDVAYTHSQEAHAPADAQANVIESVKVNGTVVTITDKAVDIAIPTDNSQLANGAGYLVAGDIANKADKATTLEGYGISDAYTSAQTDTAIANAVGQFVECSEEEINAMFPTA